MLHASLYDIYLTLVIQTIYTCQNISYGPITHHKAKLINQRASGSNSTNTKFTYIMHNWWGGRGAWSVSRCNCVWVSATYNSNWRKLWGYELTAQWGNQAHSRQYKHTSDNTTMWAFLYEHHVNHSITSRSHISITLNNSYIYIYIYI